MDFRALLLLLLAAIIHAFWNLLAKRSQDKSAFLWLALVVASVILVGPYMVLARPVAPQAAGLMIISSVLEALYYVLLGSAYQRGDLSLVYPLARGSAVLFAAIFGVVILREAVSVEGMIGIALVVAGIYTLHLQHLGWPGLRAPFASLRERPSQLALLTGLTTAGYSAVDKVGMGYLDPIPYIYPVFLATALMLTPYMLQRRRDAIRAEWRLNRRAIFAVGAMLTAAYLLVLLALTTTPVSYVAAVREMSVVFAAILGARVLHEPFGKSKVAGAVLIFAGIVFLAMAR